MDLTSQIVATGQGISLRRVQDISPAGEEIRWGDGTVSWGGAGEELGWDDDAAPDSDGVFTTQLLVTDLTTLPNIQSIPDTAVEWGADVTVSWGGDGNEVIW